MEITAIIISVIALLLSAASFYFQFFYKKDAVTCVVVGVDVKTERIAVQLAISNAGSRPIMLKEGRLTLEFKRKSGGTMGHDDINHQGVLQPILIPKDEIRSIALTLTINDDTRRCIKSWHDSGNVIDSDGSWPFHAHLIFVTVSGEIIVSHEFVIKVTWNEDGYSLFLREEPWRIR